MILIFAIFFRFFENLQAIFTCCNLSSMVAFSLDFLNNGFKRSYVCMTILWAICRGTTNTNKQNDTNFFNFFQVFWKLCRRFFRAAIWVLWLLFLLIFLIMVSKGHTCVWPFYELYVVVLQTQTNKMILIFAIFFRFFENFADDFLQAVFTCCNLSSMVAFSLDFLNNGFKRSYVCMTILWAICRGTTNTNKQNDTNCFNFFQVFWKICRRFFLAAIWVLWLLFLSIFLIMVSKGHTCVWPFYELYVVVLQTNKQNVTNFCNFFQVFWKFCRRFFLQAIFTCCNLSSMVAFSLDFLNNGFKRSYVCSIVSVLFLKVIKN